MKVTMKQVIGLWGVKYKDVADYLGFKSVSTIEKRIKRNDWKHHEIAAIVQKVENETGVKVDMNLIISNTTKN